MAHCTDSFGRGWNHMIRLLFQPFRLEYWLKMALLALFLGGTSSIQGNLGNVGGGGGGSGSLSTPGGMEEFSQYILTNLPYYLILFAAVSLLALVLAFLKATAHFLLYDGILNGVSYFGDSWRRHSGKIVTLFLWNLMVGILFGIFLVVVILLLFGLVVGGLSMSGSDVTTTIVLITLGLGIGLILFLLFMLYAELLYSVVVPVMLVKDRGIFESWTTAIRLFLENLFEFLGFIIIRLVIGIALSIVFFVLFMIFFLVFALIGLPFFGSLQPPSPEEMYLMIPALIVTVILPLAYLMNLMFLPVPVLLNAYSLSFLTNLTGDGGFEPHIQRPANGAAPVYIPTPPMPPSTPLEGGPIQFRDIPEHTNAAPPSPPSLSESEPDPRKEAPQGPPSGPYE